MRCQATCTRLTQKTGIVASQLPSASSLDERTMAYFQSVGSLEAAKKAFLDDSEEPQCSPLTASTLDNSAAPTGQKVLTQQTKLPRPSSKFTEERGKTTVEARKPGRRFVRPSLGKPEEPTTDTEVTGMEISTTSEGKASSSIENEVIGDSSVSQTTVARKRLTPEPEMLAVAQDENNIAAPPPCKRTKESESSEISEAYDIPQSSENPDATPLQGISLSEISEISQTKDELVLDKLPSASNEGCLNSGKEDEDNVPVNEESEDQQKEYLDVTNPEEVQYEGDKIIEELSDRPSASIEFLDQSPKNEEIKNILYSATEGEGDKEEGELIPDEPEQQPDDLVSDEGQHDFSIGEGAGSCDEAENSVEIASPNNEQGAHESADTSMLTVVEDVAEDSKKRNISTVVALMKPLLVPNRVLKYHQEYVMSIQCLPNRIWHQGS